MTGSASVKNTLQPADELRICERLLLPSRDHCPSRVWGGVNGFKLKALNPDSPGEAHFRSPIRSQSPAQPSGHGHFRLKMALKKCSVCFRVVLEDRILKPFRFLHILFLRGKEKRSFRRKHLRQKSTTPGHWCVRLRERPSTFPCSSDLAGTINSVPTNWKVSKL